MIVFGSGFTSKSKCLDKTIFFKNLKKNYFPSQLTNDLGDMFVFIFLISGLLDSIIIHKKLNICLIAVCNYNK